MDMAMISRIFNLMIFIADKFHVFYVQRNKMPIKNILIFKGNKPNAPIFSVFTMSKRIAI